MMGTLKALGIIKGAVAITALTAVTALATTQVSLPAAAGPGQARASAAAANGHAAGPQSVAAHTAVVDRLAANEARLVAMLEDVLARLQAGGANQHAIDAVKRIIALIQDSAHGLNRASQSVSGQGAGNGHRFDHPSPDQHPDHP